MMSHVAVEKIDGKKADSASILNELKSLAERIRQRAFEIFERRGGGEGFAIDDWLSAERDLLQAAESELVEHDGNFEIRVNAPGFDAGEIHVTALPDALIVKALSTHKHDKNKGNVRFSEYGEKMLFRRFDLPESINLDTVTANLARGVLHLTAVKAKEAAETTRAVAA